MSSHQDAQMTAKDAAAAIDSSRLWRRHMDLAKIGATGKGGLNRQALTTEDNQARRLMITWAREAGYDCQRDDAGNLFIRRPGNDPEAAPVMTGSHLDTQPTGGRFDGIYGVLAGFEALQAMDQARVTTGRPIDLVVWCNEEGSRFTPACTGSRAFANPAKLSELRAVTDLEGIDLGSEVDRLGEAIADVPKRALGGPVAAFVEAHIEQGPLLEQKAKTIGVVTGIQGARDFEIEVTGEAAHAGTTPRRLRKDAYKSAATMAVALHEVMTLGDDDDTVRFTIAQVTVEPNSPSVVPSRAAFTIDFRHPEDEILKRLGDVVEPTCQAAAGACQVAVQEIRWRKPVIFAAQVPDLIEAAAETLGISHIRLPSGASHDAAYLHPICPTGMIFVPCEGGISHNEAENCDPGDLADGARVLALVLARLADQ
jgi:N-carbamoyl-L-amino-acid hydrolase